MSGSEVRAKVLFLFLGTVILVLLVLLSKAYCSGMERGLALNRPKVITLFGSGETNCFSDVRRILVRMPHDRSLEINLSTLTDESIGIRMVEEQCNSNGTVRLGTCRSLGGGIRVGVYQVESKSLNP